MATKTKKKAGKATRKSTRGKKSGALARRKPAGALDVRKSFSLLNINDAADRLGEDLPIYKIEYKGRRDVPGEYEKGKITMSTGGQLDSIEFVWLSMAFGRILWPDPYDPKDPKPKPLCKSQDGVRPCDGEDMRKGPCAACPEKEWGNNGKRPPCSEVYTLLCWHYDEKCPFIFAVKRTGIKALRALKTALKQKIATFGYKGLPINTCAKVRLTIEPRENYYVPRFEIMDRLPQEEALEFANVAAGLLPVFSKSDIEDVTNGDVSEE